MDSVPKRRRPCFLDRNDGLASLTANHQHSNNPLISRPLYLQRRSSLKDISSPRLANGRSFYETRFEIPQPHFLEACFLCEKTLGDNTDIFMYRGDNRFCSEECRQEQIEMDEAKEKKLNLSALRKKDKRKSTSSNETAQDYPLHRGTVAAA